MNREQLKEWKEQIKIAKDLCYPKIVIEKLMAEPNPIRRDAILHDARNGVYEEA